MIGKEMKQPSCRMNAPESVANPFNHVAQVVDASIGKLLSQDVRPYSYESCSGGDAPQSPQSKPRPVGAKNHSVQQPITVAQRGLDEYTLREKVIKIGAKVLSHARCVIFQMAAVAASKELFAVILARIRRLRLLGEATM
jgi:hypothetical protein